MNYPHDDDNMRFDDNTKMYYLKEKALDNMGINLRARLAARKYSAPEMLIEELLNINTEMIYGYIHEFSIDNDRQNYILATAPSARNILLRALKMQIVHILNVGNLSYSTDQKERAAAVNDMAKTILNQPIKEVGAAITYIGVC